nr:MAG TPA: major capsid protein [Caudoviricetes sp.]
MNEAQMKQIAEVLAKSLEDSVPAAVEAAVDAKLKELNLSENADIKEIKEQIKTLVEKAKFGNAEENLEQTKKDFIGALVALRSGDESAIKAMNTGTPGDGGYLVHPEFEKGVFRLMENYGIWKDCTISKMSSSVKYFILRKTGLKVFYVDEAGAYQDTAMDYERKELTAKKVGAILSATYELIADNAESDEIWAKAQEEFAQAFAMFLDKEVLTGTGAGQSKIKGICNLQNVNVITTSGNAATLTANNLIDATRKVALKYKENAKPTWYLSQDAIAIIEKLKDSDGRPLYRTLDNGEKGYLLGYPVKLTDVMPSGSIAVNTPFIAFGALKHFAIGIRKGLSFEVGYKTGDWEKDIQSIKGSARVCGISLADEAFAVIKTHA